MIQDEAIDRLRAYARREGKSQWTDVLGAIASITDVEPRPGVRQLLVIGSDLHDLCGGPEGLASLDLGGLEVLVVYCEQDLDLEEYDRRVEAWERGFAGAGAAPVRLLNPTASRCLDLDALLGGEF